MLHTMKLNFYDLQNEMCTMTKYEAGMKRKKFKKWSKITWGIIFTRKLGGETKSLKGNEEKELFTLTMYMRHWRQNQTMCKACEAF